MTVVKVFMDKESQVREGKMKDENKRDKRGNIDKMTSERFREKKRTFKLQSDVLRR